ncbi:ZrgA family zinc uptake protein [Agaribacterium haliotis]|uniref:ZrgA family zinc uptake protein n=1 Tax=Agaribacterium haliotis TaxID=2013869 RepID=UPI001303FC84|nr:DUF2796 domain-containing protein [Agaribacterium haliotis]
MLISNSALAGEHQHSSEHLHNSEHQHTEQHTEHQHEQHQAHAHGLADLSLAVEGDTLEILFESPAANLVGFEHRAQKTEEIETVRRVQHQLQQADKIFIVKPEHCKLNMADVDVSQLLASEYLDNAHQHNSESHNKHKHSEHSEISAHYRFICKKATTTKTVSVKLFDLFPKLERIEAQWISSQQGAAHLDRQNTDIRL